TRPAAYWPAVFWPPVFWPPVLLWRTWHEGARGLCAWLAGREPESARLPVDALGWTAPVEDHLTSRMLGTWLDGGALADVAGVRLPALEPAELRAVTGLALGRVRAAAGVTGGVLALTLTSAIARDGAGPPGGALDRGLAPGTAALGQRAPSGDAVVARWRVGPGREPAAAPDRAADPPVVAEVCLDVVDFCLLAAGRRTPAETAALAVTVAGDPAASRALIAGAAGVLPA
ncbi:hypothetical protein I6A84_16505, partial [Frankia sp. CNm7]|nr:hypothetical protein [Frankia nepalensis]